VVRGMLAGGNWLLPTLGEKPYIMKPPLFYWAAAFFGLIFRSSAEWVVRLPSAVSAFLVTWLTFDRVKRYPGRWPAFFSALILITSYKFSLYARRGEIEMLLTLCYALAASLFLDHLKAPQARWRLYLSYAFCGLAFLAKGPAGLPFFLPPLFVAIQPSLQRIQQTQGNASIFFLQTQVPKAHQLLLEADSSHP